MAHPRLLDIAAREFGLKGLEGASTRSIAAAAGTAMSSITYHYGGKEGLYLAAADHIAAQIGGDMAAALGSDGRPVQDPVVARATIQTVLALFVDKMIGAQSSNYALFIVREQMNPTEGFDRIYGGMMGQMLEQVAKLVGIATGGDDGDEARIVTVTLLGQVVALRASRASTLRLLDRTSIEDIAEPLRARIAANTDAILDRLIAERQEPR